MKNLALSVPALLWALSAGAQVPAIVEEIGELESVRDPKCYATASRLEDFIYGTPLDSGARFLKIELQKQLIRGVWLRASDAARAAGATSISEQHMAPLLAGVLPFHPQKDGGSLLLPSDPERSVEISGRDLRQYGSVAYALRAILGVQQDAFVDGTKLLPLEPAALEAVKKTVDLATLGVLQRADRAARKNNERSVSMDHLRTAWKALLPLGDTAPAAAAPTEITGDRFATIRAIVAKKLEAFEAYNQISSPVFLRNLQVYLSRHPWPADPGEATSLRDQFTTTMVAWTSDVMQEAEKKARAAGHPLIRIGDVHEAIQLYQPHELNEYEDCIYFPRLSREERVVIEAYDLDSFRDPGLHWLYLERVLNDPGYSGTLEPDPFAAELLTEGAAQMGTLILRVTGDVARASGAAQLNSSHLAEAVQKIQRLLNRHASAAATPKSRPAPVASAPGLSRPGTGKRFTDVTAWSGIRFEHRLADWLARFIRGYRIVDGNRLRLVVPPAFGGAGVGAEDLDGDGDIDLLLLSGAGNAIYRNDGKGRFEDVTARSGLVWKRPDGTFGEPRQPIIADFDNDGARDILITYAGDDHRLYKGRGDGTFEDVTAGSNLGGSGLVGGPATALDFDEDGLLDLYIGYFGHYTGKELPTLARRNTNGLPNRLFRNRGGFHFDDVTEGSGVDNRGWTQAVGHADFDGDGREDLICGNDFGVNAWYRNLGDGRFEDVSATVGTDKPSYTMGIGISDLNRDGHPDFYISNIVTMDKDEKYVLPQAKVRMKFDPDKMAQMRVVEANDLFISRSSSNGSPRWELSDAVGRGYRATGWSWGAGFSDFDHDGDDDLYVLNGMNDFAIYSSVNTYTAEETGEVRQVVMPVSNEETNVFFINQGGKLVEESERSGLALEGNSRSAVHADLDSDGDLDIVINNFKAPANVYRNNHPAERANWIKVRLTGRPDLGVTRDAIGAQVIVNTRHHKRLWREVLSTTDYLTSPPRELHFGLGEDDRADVTIIWPNGQREVHTGLRANRTHALLQGPSAP